MSAKAEGKKGPGDEEAGDDPEKAVQQWKVKQLIKNLEAARGNGTSMISLIIPPKDQISRVNKMLGDEYGTASNIKSRVNRLSVLGAITSVQARLKLYNKVPPNGLVIYCGTVVTDEGKEKKVSIDFEPFKPINTSLYLCDNKFHTEALQELLENDEKFGFIIMDGNGTLWGTLCGNTRTIIHKISVELPKKHGRGGQSSVRFARLRVEKRHAYLRKVAELSTQLFITDNKCNVSGIVLAGSAEFKNELNKSDLFDPRLASQVTKIVDVSYGGENGFSQAIELSAADLGNVKFIREKKLLSNYFAEIAKDTGKYCFGVRDTMYALEQSAVDYLILWEELSINRYKVRSKDDGKERVLLLDETQEKNSNNFKDAKTGAELEVLDKQPLLQWLSDNFKDFGCKLVFVSNKSQEGSQFCRGFGGIGCILRYQLQFHALDDAEKDHEESSAAAPSGGDVDIVESNHDAFDDSDFI